MAGRALLAGYPRYICICVCVCLCVIYIMVVMFHYDLRDNHILFTDLYGFFNNMSIQYGRKCNITVSGPSCTNKYIWEHAMDSGLIPISFVWCKYSILPPLQRISSQTMRTNKYSTYQVKVDMMTYPYFKSDIDLWKLTHIPPGDMAVILKWNFRTHITEGAMPSGKCHITHLMLCPHCLM